MLKRNNVMDLKGFLKANYLHGNVTMKFDL